MQRNSRSRQPVRVPVLGLYLLAGIGLAALLAAVAAVSVPAGQVLAVVALVAAVGFAVVQVRR